MVSKIVMVSMVFALSACSSGSDNAAAPGGGNGEPPATDSKAGVWQGDLGFGDGVYIVDNNNNLYGLASQDGSAYHSLFGNLGAGSTFNGSLDTAFHPATNAVKGIAFAPQGEDLETVPTFNLNIVNGQTIESLDTNNPFTLTFASNGLQPAATAASVAGTWNGVHSYCASATSCTEFTIELTFSGNSLTGATGVAALPNGDNDFPAVMSGSISEFGSVLTTSYTWNGQSLAGVIYFDANGNLILNGNDPSNKTISSKLSR